MNKKVYLVIDNIGEDFFEESVVVFSDFDSAVSHARNTYSWMKVAAKDPEQTSVFGEATGNDQLLRAFYRDGIKYLLYEKEGGHVEPWAIILEKEVR